MRLEFFIAFRYLFSSKKSRAISFIGNISIAGIAIGLMSLIVVLSIMNGFEQDLKQSLIGANAHLRLSSLQKDSSQKIPYNEEIIESIKQAIPVKHLSPFSISQALISSKSAINGILLKGIDIKKEAEGEVLTNFIKLENKDDAPFITPKQVNLVLNDLKIQPRKNKEKIAGIIIGSQLAKQIKIQRGDALTILTTKQKPSPFGALPQKRKFIVSGFYKSGLSSYDELFTLIDLEEFNRIFGQEGFVRAYGIYLDRIKDTEAFREKLQFAFPFPFLVSSWIDDNYNLFAVLQLEKIGLGVILFLIILVAAFNIISSLVILVSEKKRDIAILKAIGTSNSTIRNIFLLQGFSVGFIGTIIGTSLGLLVCFFLKNFSIIEIPAGVYITDRIPILISWWQIATMLIISFIACFLVTYFPAKKAAELLPIENLKL